MKYILPLSFFLLLYSCSPKSETKQEQKTDTSSVTDKKEELTVKEPAVYTWKGKLNKKIPVFLWYSIQDSVVAGELTYLNTKNKIPIKILGEIKKDGFRLCEFEKDGNITGVHYGIVTKDSLTGSWFSPGSDKELTLNLTAYDTTLNANDNAIFSTGRPEGQYAYSYSKGGAQGTLSIKQLSGDQLLIEFLTVTDPPAYNIAELKDTVKIQDNTSIYESNESGPCKFRLRFFKDFLVVDYRDEKYDCGFGHNATVDGAYIKISDVYKPIVEEH